MRTCCSKAVIARLGSDLSSTQAAFSSFWTVSSLYATRYFRTVGRKAFVRIGDLVKAIDPATGQVAWKRVTERHERTAIAGIVRVTMEDAFGQRETLTVTQNHPYLRAANDSLVGVTDSRSALEGREAIGAHGPGILNAVRLDPGGDWSAAGLLKPGDKVQSGKGAHLEVNRPGFSGGSFV